MSGRYTARMADKRFGFSESMPNLISHILIRAEPYPKTRKLEGVFSAKRGGKYLFYLECRILVPLKREGEVSNSSITPWIRMGELFPSLVASEI